MSSFTEPFHLFDVLSRDDRSITISVDKEIFAGHSRVVYSLLFFGNPHNKIVSCSYDKTIRIWSYETSECLKIIKKHVNVVKDLIKLTDKVFLSGSSDRTVRSFNISSPNFEQEKKFEIIDGPIVGLLRLTNDLFCARTWYKKLFICSYKNERILKRFYVGHLFHYVYRPLHLSQKYPNCFYVATSDEHETIKLVNYEQDEVVKEFKGHDKNEKIFSLSLFFNSKNEEILIATHTAKKIYSYNTSHPQFNTRIKISHIKKWVNSKNYKYPKDLIYCSFSFNNQYLICGDDAGYVHFYELQETENSIKKIKEQKIHQRTINDILFLPDRQVILTCSSDYRNMMKATQVEGLSRRTNYDVSDRNERVEYLLEYMKENNEFFFKFFILQLGDTVEIIVPKTLFV